MTADQPQPVNPVLLRHLRERGKRRENRVADQITRFAGSMKFVYLHLVWFSLWIGLGVEDYPFGLLTMIVSLEAIFLSTFVMISQNRADEKRQVIADEAWRTVQEEEQQNETLLRQFEEILELTREIHAASASPASPSRHGASCCSSRSRAFSRSRSSTMAIPARFNPAASRSAIRRRRSRSSLL